MFDCLFGGHTKIHQGARAECDRQRYVGRVTAAGDHYPSDPRIVVAPVGCAPGAAQEDLDPGGEILGRLWQSTVGKRSPKSSSLIALTWPPDPISSSHRETLPNRISTQFPTASLPQTRLTLLERAGPVTIILALLIRRANR
jgi:hypothetical protein